MISVSRVGHFKKSTYFLYRASQESRRDKNHQIITNFRYVIQWLTTNIVIIVVIEQGYKLQKMNQSEFRHLPFGHTNVNIVVEATELAHGKLNRFAPGYYSTENGNKIKLSQKITKLTRNTRHNSTRRYYNT